jgi:hypothetical protein
MRTRRALGCVLSCLLTGAAIGQVPNGLPASDVLGSEDTWDNPTFVGGVINGGPSASSEY